MKNPKQIAAAIVSCLFVVGCIFLVVGNREKTPEDAVRQRLKNEHSSFRLMRLIEQVEIDRNTWLLFYYTESGGVANVVVERKVFGFDITSYSGEVAVERNTVPTSIGLVPFGEGKSLVWHVLYDKSITRAVIEGTEANIIVHDDITIYYLVSALEEVPRGEFYRGDELIWTLD